MTSEEVCSVVEQYGTADSAELAGNLGIKVISRPLDELYGYFLSAHGQKIIVINNTLPEHLQRFILAHKIGHALLHPEKSVLLLKKSLLSEQTFESEADKFAIHILMPDRIIADAPNRTIEEWSNIYGLPKEIISLRFE